MVAVRASRALVVLVLGLLMALTLASCGTSSSDDQASAGPTDLCSPPGVDSASSTPTNFDAAGAAATEDKYTTANVTPLVRIDTSTLGLVTPGVLTVGTLSDAPPSICLDASGQYTGYDTEL